jgi:hypothetical protein
MDEIDPVRARAPAALIPQPHGGAIAPPWTEGTGTAARRSSVRAIRRETLALLSEGTPRAARVLLAMLDSDDERCRAVAASQILDRVLGKPSSEPQATDDKAGALDISHLAPEQRAEAWAAVATLERLVWPAMVGHARQEGAQ